MKFLNLIILIFLLNFNSLFAKQASVVDIRLSTNKNTERIVIDLNANVNFNAFTLQKPNRLVVDLQNTSLDVEAPSFKSNNIVSTIRTGRFSETDTRLVFDLNIRAQIIKSFMLSPTEENKKYRVVIDLSYNEDDLAKEDMIGKLIEDNNLYDVEPNALDAIIDKIIAENSKSEANVLNNLIDEILTAENRPKNPPKNQLSYSAPQNNRKPRIVIDAGHGGKDPGTIGLRGTKEKIITLTYAKSLKEALDATGKYKVYLTRNQDFFIELMERVSIARRYKGDLFISIHADAAENRSARGVSIYTLSQKASDTRTAKLAQKENKADIIGGLNLYGEFQDTVNTLVDISRRQAMNDSKKFSRLLEAEFKNRNIKGLGNMVKHANFAVLTSADMPSILLELGFLSNNTDERMIRSYGYKTKVVNSIISAINKYFKK